MPRLGTSGQVSSDRRCVELHVSLVAAIPNGIYVEHIPQLRAITKGEIEIVDGQAIAPSQPGLGIDWDRDAIDHLRGA